MTKLKKTEEKYPKPVWVKMTEEELKKIILELSEKYQPAQVGLVLRDQYGIPTTKIYGKKLSHYLKELGKDHYVEVKNMEKRLEKLKDHTRKNVTDKIAKHKLQKIQSKHNALKKYVDKRKARK